MYRHIKQPRIISRRWYRRPVVWTFLLLIGLIALINTMAVFNMERIERDFLQETLVNIEKLRLIDEMVHLSRQRSVLLRDILISNDPFDQDEIAQKHSALASHYLQVRNAFSQLPLTASENALLKNIIKLNTESYQLQLTILELATTGYTDKALQLINTELLPNRKQIFSDMEKMRELMLDTSGSLKQTAVQQMQQDRRVLNWLFALALVIGVLVAWLSYRQDSRNNRYLHWQSSHDLLTGLGNRYEAEFQLTELIADSHRREAKHALLYLDIDQFNIINNTSGHAAGDELLKQMAVRLLQAIGDDGDVYRVGSDQFSILLKDKTIDEARGCARNLQASISKDRFVWSDKNYAVTASISVVPITRGTGNAESLWSDAYLACDIAKEQGGDNIEVVLESSHKAQQRREGVDWASRLRSAMKEERLVLFSQGIQSISNGMTHSEILIRYEEENGDIVPAEKFIPAAERYNLISEIDQYVVRKTLQHMGRDSSNHRYSINLSGLSLGSHELLDLIISEISANEVNPEHVCFEITETAAIKNHTAAVQFMNVLHGMGCHFFLDDFGTGLSSFGYLRTLPLDMIKIDAHFIHNLDADSANRAIIEAINTIAHGFGMSTVAEGVEDEKQLAVLQEIGIDFVQGYLIQRPRRLIAA